MYVVTKEGRGDVTLFLVDRSKIKDRWWSSDYLDAFRFEKESVARTQARKLKYGVLGVVSLEQAEVFSRDQEREPDDPSDDEYWVNKEL